jgi:hypothetical protein
VTRHRGLAHRELVDQLADCSLTCEQEVEDPATTGFGDDGEGLGGGHP